MENISKLFGISEETISAAKKALDECSRSFKNIERITRIRQQKVLKAFIDNSISESHFAASTGYGYNDRGRDTLDIVAAQALDCEDAIFRHSFVSGTHALTVALFGVLRPGDTMLCVTGTPYDTLRGVIGINEGCGTLKEFGINYKEIDLLEDGTVDLKSIPEAITGDVKMVYIQRSRGYSLRPSLTVDDIEKIVKTVRSTCKDVIIMVDNCYGEFVCENEPCSVGADLMAGSLIKNAGGGIAPTGGYITGRRDLVEMCACRLTTPSTGREIGCSLGHTRELFMGLYSAPHVVGEALKTAEFCAHLFTIMGYKTAPCPDTVRGDIIQSVLLENSERLIAFCQGIQSGSAIDSSAVPVPDAMPGYDCDIIMASGSFTLGSSIELSADAPLRDPYAVWMQGGLNFDAAMIGILLAADRVKNS